MTPILKQVQSVSRFWFFFLGFGYVIAYFLKANSVFILWDEYYFRLADSPLLFCAILYFFLTLRIKSERVHRLTRIDSNETKDFFLLEASFITIGTILFFGYFAIDLLG